MTTKAGAARKEGLEQCKRLPHPGPGRENLPGDAAVEADLALDRPRFILGPWTSLQSGLEA